MAALKAISTAVGWCVACTAVAQVPAGDVPQENVALFIEPAISVSPHDQASPGSGGVTGVPGSGDNPDTSIQTSAFADSREDAGLADQRSGAQLARFTASYETAKVRDASPGILSRQVTPALGPPISAMRKFAGVDNPNGVESAHWLNSGYEVSRVLTLGYAWRDVLVEGSAFSGDDRTESVAPEASRLRLDSRSARMTFKPSPDWSVQFSKGALNGLDQVVAGGDVRRTTLSTTYRRALSLGTWETTLAWGRNARKSREATVGYLAESSFQFDGAHALFGRVERVGSDELLRENESYQRQPFKLSKVTLGYVHDVSSTPALSLDVGMLVSRYLVPSHVAPAYGKDPTAYMFVVRIGLR